VRRLAVIALVAVVGAAVLVAVGGGGNDRYRVDAVFDNAASLIPGNVVKIAGAPVGEVKDIRLTPDRKARVELEIEPGFAPFRSDARCVIAPESLFIGEKFVQCEPGTPKGRPLAGGGVPTVPLERNSATVDLDLVLSTLRMPVRERLTILFNELGAGLAGRPKELAQAVERANPALANTNRVLRVLDRDRDTLGRLVESSDEVLDELASRRGAVQDFISHAGEVTEVTASRQDDLQETVRRLPALLGELQPASERLAALSRQATPALRHLRAAAPDVANLLRDVEPVSRSGRPAIAELSRTARVGRRAVRPARPLARGLARAATRLPDVVSLTAGLLESAREKGALEGIGSFVYYTALSTSRYDRVSHMLPAYGLLNLCVLYASAPVKGCDAHPGGSAGGSSGSSARPVDARPVLNAMRQAARPAPARAPDRDRSRARDRGSDRLDIPGLDYLLGP
jgi:ABC-type transporter Mla subunit MlaD